MTAKRSSIFDSDSADIDLSSFKPKDGPPAHAVPAEQVRAIAEASNFPSREAKKSREDAPARRQARRLRTYRTAQLNVRATEQTVQDFYTIADAKGWKAAETLERAVAALQRELQGS